MAEEQQSVSVSTTIDAPPERLHAMVSDVTRMGEWSPETYRCVWLGDDRKRFRGYNRKGVVRWWTTSEVVRNQPGEEFTFDVTSLFSVPVARWSYRFEGVGDGRTVVTESWEDRRPSGLVKRVTGLLTTVPDRAVHNRKGMEQTLARIKAAAERG